MASEKREEAKLCIANERYDERQRLLPDDADRDARRYDGSEENCENGTGDEGLHSKISVWEASWCINNVIQGLPVVGLPFTILQGGYWALLEIIIFGAIACYTGKLLIDCLYETDENGNRVRVRRSYSDVAAVCMGRRLGPAMVNVALLAELVMICTLFVIICGDLLEAFEIAEHLTVRMWILITGVFVLPYAFLKNIKYAAWISTVCMVIHAIMTVTVFGYCFSQALDWKWKEVAVRPTVQNVSLAAGVILTSNMGHVVFPITEGNMAKPQKFWPMLKWTYFLASLLKFFFAYLPFLTFGEDTNGEISNNLPNIFQMRTIINILLILRGFLSYSLPYITMVEIITDMFFKPFNQDQQESTAQFPSCFTQSSSGHNINLKWWAVLARMGVICVTILIGFAMPYFDIIASLFVSFCGSLIVIIWPCMFHIKLHRPSISWFVLAFEILLIVFGVFYAITGFIFAVVALTDRYNELFNS